MIKCDTFSGWPNWVILTIKWKHSCWSCWAWLQDFKERKGVGGSLVKWMSHRALLTCSTLRREIKGWWSPCEMTWAQSHWVTSTMESPTGGFKMKWRFLGSCGGRVLLQGEGRLSPKLCSPPCSPSCTSFFLPPFPAPFLLLFPHLYLYLDLSLSLSLYLAISTYLSISLSLISLSFIYLFLYLSIISVCLSLSTYHLSISLAIYHLSLSSSLSLFIHLSIHSSI